MNLVIVCILRRIPNGVLRQVPVYGQKIFDICTRRYGSQGNSFGKTMLVEYNSLEILYAIIN